MTDLDLRGKRVLIREDLNVPVADGNPPPRSQAKEPSRRQMVACEPVVSVLTEVAKQLQPGRCVT